MNANKFLREHLRTVAINTTVFVRLTLTRSIAFCFNKLTLLQVLIIAVI